MLVVFRFQVPRHYFSGIGVWDGAERQQVRAQMIHSKNVNIIIAASLQIVSIGKSVDIVELYMHNLTLFHEGTPVMKKLIWVGCVT